jgi:hypothetical protein
MAISDSKFSHGKQPAEEYPIGVKFGNRLASGVTISSVAVTAIDLADDSDASSIIINGSYQIGTLAADNITFTVESGTVVAQGIKGGVDGSRYKISLLATDSAGNKHEADIILSGDEN